VEEWDARGFSTSADLRAWEHDVVTADREKWRTYNDDMLPQWIAAQPRQAAREAISWAEAVDRKIASLSTELTQAILNTSPFWDIRRPWTIDRSIHRREHLDEIASVLGS
jgi:hypothetical protein